MVIKRGTADLSQYGQPRAVLICYFRDVLKTLGSSTTTQEWPEQGMMTSHY